MDIYIARGEDHNGPYSEDAIRQFLADGELGGTELAWREGLDGWINVKELVECAAPAELQGLKVFISYRRADSQSAAGFLHHLLIDHFSSENVFFDVDSLHPGRNYEDDLDEHISQCDVLLVLIGQRWVTVDNEDGERRLFDENDFVRKEIISAMDQGKTVMPILVEKAEMPTSDFLPKPLEKLCKQQATPVRPGPDFTKDVAKLIKELERIESAKEIPSGDEQVIEASIRMKIKKFTGQLNKEDFEKVEDLLLGAEQLTDVSALKNLTQLWNLKLDENQLADVSALKDLTQLLWLSLQNNQLTDVIALKNLAHLVWLYLQNNQLTDVSALKNLTQLKNLYLSGNQLTDVSDLSGLTQLTRLGLTGNQLTNVSALKDLTQLKNLYLSGNQLTDVNDLAKLSQLTSLGLHTNQLTDVSTLTGLTQLQELWLGDNPKLAEAEIEKLRQALPECEISLESRL